MANKKGNKKTNKKDDRKISVRKYQPGQATIIRTKPEGWTQSLFSTWLKQRTDLGRKLVVNEARCYPNRFKDPDGNVPQLEPIVEPILPWVDKREKEREEWLARIKTREEEDRLIMDAKRRKNAG